jgi:hypothetical protein
MYQKCGVQYEFRYIRGMKVPPGVAQIRGSAVHRSIEHNYRQKIGSKTDLPLDVVKDVAAEAVDVSFAGEVSFLEEEEKVGVRKIRDTTKDTAVGLAQAYREKKAPTIQPIAVEEHVTVSPDPSAFPRPLTGIEDLVDDQRIVHDTKTASKTPNADAADKSQQLSMYAILERARSGQDPAGLALDTLIETSGGKRSIVTQTTTRTPEDASRLLLRLATAIRGIEAGVFVPTNPENWWCSNKWCGYFNVCPFVRH